MDREGGGSILGEGIIDTDAFTHPDGLCGQKDLKVLHEKDICIRRPPLARSRIGSFVFKSLSGALVNKIADLYDSPAPRHGKTTDKEQIRSVLQPEFI